MSLDDQDLSSLIRRHATRHAAPDALRAGIRTQVALADAGRAESRAPSRSTLRDWLAPRWRTASVSFALGLVCAMLVLPLAQRLDPIPSMEGELVADHVRALQAGPLTEVASTDRHTVKPWFQGRLDYAPPVFDLAAQGFPLMGGRLEHVHGSAVAALAYARNRHVIDVFVWPSSAQAAPARRQYRGFNVLHWADGSMQYWAVSDLERTEMERFAQLWREQAAAQQ
ncbi:MAG TPA: anti-sigma factor [Burkholderiaceae bacterium]|nr:anti-sigma factor [Burkholderiaceae bacterium]